MSEAKGPSLHKSELVLAALLAGETLTCLEAAFRWNTVCLAQIVCHLRKHRSVPIESVRHEEVNEYGELRRFVSYRMNPNAIAEYKASGGKK